MEGIDKIELKYQQIVEVLYTSRNIESLTSDQIDIKNLYKNDDRNPFNLFIIISNSNDENEENENDGDDTEIEKEKQKKISDLSLIYIEYIYEILNIFVTTTNDDLKDDIVNKLFKNTKEILMETNNLITNNTKIKNNKNISLYYSDLIVMENSLCSILDLYENEELQFLFSDIRQSCVSLIIHSLSLINTSIINNFNKLDFDKYPILNDDYNNYVKDFTKIKDVYDEINN